MSQPQRQPAIAIATEISAEYDLADAPTQPIPPAPAPAPAREPEPALHLHDARYLAYHIRERHGGAWHAYVMPLEDADGKRLGHVIVAQHRATQLKFLLHSVAEWAELRHRQTSAAGADGASDATIRSALLQSPSMLHPVPAPRKPGTAATVE